MYSVAFITLALVSIFSALMVISRPNPVASVLWLVLNFFSLAGLYVLLGAQFLAAVQIIVYAGAIMVLFLFVIMMLNLNQLASQERGSILVKALGAVIAGMILVMVAMAVRTGVPVDGLAAGDPATLEMGSAKMIGLALFDRTMLPFQIVGVMLLAAMVGVVALTKMKRKNGESR